MKILTSICVLLFAYTQTTPASMPLTPIHPYPPNPYCNRTLDSFSMPVVECPNDGFMYQVNLECIDRCLATYRACMLQAFDTACDQYNQANINYETAMRLSLQEYDLCFAAAQTVIEREACRTTVLRNFNEALQVLDQDRDTIETDFVINTHECKRQFGLCAGDCCIKVW